MMIFISILAYAITAAIAISVAVVIAVKIIDRFTD